MDELTKEFLVESYENLDLMDQDFVALEKNPSQEILGRSFRVIHTIKGTCGFLGFGKLESLTHVGENLLSLLRDGVLQLTPTITDVLLAMLDAVRQMLASIEMAGNEGERDDTALIARIGALLVTDEQSKLAIEEREERDSSGLTNRSKFGEILVKQGKVSRAELNRALEQQDKGDPRRLGEILVEQGSIHPDAVLAALHAQNEIKAVSDRIVRVDVNLLDKLMNLVGELVLARNQILQYTHDWHDASYLATIQRLNLITTELQEGVMKTRMQPVGNIWNQLPRLVRDLAASCKKQARLEVEGKETELDKTIIEAIKDPLTHILRNSIDHGIETPEKRILCGKPVEGKLLLRAFHEGGQVNIEIGDDGAGIHPESIRERAVKRGLITPEQGTRMSEREILNLIFVPGFSTAETVTNISGRGVGMDVVKTNIEKISGSVEVQSRWGAGTNIKLKIPLTLAIIPALLVTSGGGHFAIPQGNVVELVRPGSARMHQDVELVFDAPVYRLRGHLLPLVFLSRELNVPEGQRDLSIRQFHIVVLQADRRRFGLVVDEVGDSEDIVVKPLGRHFKDISVFSGATILGDGSVALILDVIGLAPKTTVLSKAGVETAVESLSPLISVSSRQQSLLITRTTTDENIGIPLSHVSRLEEFPISSVERSGGREVVQYRGEIMPLIRVSSGLSGTSAAHRFDSESIHVVVLRDYARHIGLVVDQIIDIVEDQVLMTQAERRGKILGSAVVLDRFTDILDVEGIVRSAGLSLGAT